MLVVVAIFFNTELVPLLPGVFDALLEAAAFAGVPLAVPTTFTDPPKGSARAGPQGS